MAGLGFPATIGAIYGVPVFVNPDYLVTITVVLSNLWIGFRVLSLEKILKALYVKRHSNHAPFTHNLLSPLEKNQIQPSESDLKIFSEINEFNLEARNPDEKFRLQQIATQQFAARYLRETKRLSVWIAEKLNS